MEYLLKEIASIVEQLNQIRKLKEDLLLPETHRILNSSKVSAEEINRQMDEYYDILGCGNTEQDSWKLHELLSTISPADAREHSEFYDRLFKKTPPPVLTPKLP